VAGEKGSSLLANLIVFPPRFLINAGSLQTRLLWTTLIHSDAMSAIGTKQTSE